MIVISGSGGQLLRTQAGGMMDMAGLTNILAGAGAGHRISLEGEAGEQPGQSMEVSGE